MTRQDAIKEIERELKLRERVYPKWIASGKLNRDVARKQYARLRAAKNFLEGDIYAVTGKQKELF